MNKNPNKDETFNNFMHALGFEWIDKPTIAPSHHYWYNKQLDLGITPHYSTDTIEHIVSEYNRHLKAQTIKEQQRALRNCLLQFMGLTTGDLYSRCDDVIAKDVVKVDEF